MCSTGVCTSTEYHDPGLKLQIRDGMSCLLRKARQKVFFGSKIRTGKWFTHNGPGVIFETDT